MKTARGQPAARPAPSRELATLRARLAVAEETLRAIRSGEVDAVVVAGRHGPQVFTLQGAEQAYRVLIESMNEGALTLTMGAVILYANQRFAKMVQRSLEQVIGSSFRSYLSAQDRATLRPLLTQVTQSGSKIQVHLHAGGGLRVPVLISLQPLAASGTPRAILTVVVTDMTEVRRAEEQLRALTHRVVQVQEAERGRVALELHDHITQQLCAILCRSQALEAQLAARDEPARREVMKLGTMLGQAAEEVERISRQLRPGVLEQLGLVAVLRDTSARFAERTGVSVKLACAPLTARLPADTELTLYRVFQEALENVEQHARARHVSARLRQQGAFVLLVIQDDGIGFDPVPPPARRKRKSGLGLLSIRERATCAGGTLTVKSAPGQGTTLRAQIPFKLEAAGEPLNRE